MITDILYTSRVILPTLINMIDIVEIIEIKFHIINQ